MVAARLSTGQDIKAGDSRQEDSFQRGSGDHYLTKLFGVKAQPQLLGAILKDAGAPAEHIVNKRSSVQGGYNQGLASVLNILAQDMKKSPDLYYLGPDASLSAAANGVESKYDYVPTVNGSLQKNADFVQVAYNKLFQNLKEVVVPQLAMPGMAPSSDSAGDVTFRSMTNLFLNELKAEIKAFSPPDSDPWVKQILTSPDKDAGPTTNPDAKPKLEFQKVNGEGLVGGKRQR